MAKAATAIANPTNGAAPDIALSEPYIVGLTIQGVAPLLCHAWNNEAVAEKAGAVKGSAAKKSDNVESYVYRCSDGSIGIPGSYLAGAIAGPQGAAKFRQDPRSPRKSALDLFKAGCLVLTDIAPILVGDKATPATTWDYLDARRVTVQRAAITRVRPAFLPGWTLYFELAVQVPEYIRTDLLHDVISQAGKLVGLGDFRPSHGRFAITKFEILSL